MANALLNRVRKRLIDLEPAAATIDVLRPLPIRPTALREMAVPALRLADARGLSVHDACSVVLAEQAGAVLITADRRLARAAGESVLVG